MKALEDFIDKELSELRKEDICFNEWDGETYKYHVIYKIAEKVRNLTLEGKL